MATSNPDPSETPSNGSLLAANLRLARKLSGDSQLQLAIKAEVDPQQISKWERGILKPSTPNLVALATALKRDLGWFYEQHEPTEAAA